MKTKAVTSQHNLRATRTFVLLKNLTTPELPRPRLPLVSPAPHGNVVADFQNPVIVFDIGPFVGVISYLLPKIRIILYL